MDESKMSQSIGVRDLYTSLKARAEDKNESYSMTGLIVRLREGIKAPHARNVLSLYWWHLFLTYRPMYTRLKTATDEHSMRQMVGGLVETAYMQGEKGISVTSETFPDDFFPIIDAYIDYTDELHSRSLD